MLKKAWRWLATGIGYLLYGTALLVILLWLLFPQETVRRHLEESLGRVCPDQRWQVGAVALDLSAGLTIRAIAGSERGKEDKPLVRIETLTLRPQVIESLRAGNVQFGYRMGLGKGNVVGLVRLDGGDKRMHLEGTILDVSLEAIPLLSRCLGRTVQGVASGTFAITGSIAPGKENGIVLEAQVQVDNGRVGLKRPLLGHTELPFSRGTVVLHGQGETLQLEQGVVESELFASRFAGMLTVHRDPGLSQLDVQGAMQPKNKLFRGLDNNNLALQAFRVQLKENTLPFRISGELSNPGIHFEEYSMLIQTLEKELQ